MKKSLSIAGIVLLGLSGCSHFGSHAHKSHSLNETINVVKEELRAFNYALHADRNKDGQADMTYICDGKEYSIASNVDISDITVTVAVGNKSEAHGVNEGSPIVTNGSNLNGNSLALSLVPENIPNDDFYAVASKNGIANHLIAIVNQLTQVNASEACSGRGEKSTITLGFNVRSAQESNRTTDLVVFSSRGSGSATRVHKNQIEVTFDFGGNSSLAKNR